MSAVADLNGNVASDVIGIVDNSHFQVLTDVALSNDTQVYGTANGAGVQGFAVDDFNSDGVPDVMTEGPGDFELFKGYWDGSMYNGLMTPSTTVTAPNRSYNFFSSMDVNHDNIPDLVFTDLFHVSVKIGHGDGTFDGAKTLYDSTASAYGISMAAIGRFDDNDNGDIAVYEEQHLANGTNVPRLTVLYGDGKGNFTTVHFPLSSTITSQNMTADDVNRDGLTDLVAWTGTNTQPATIKLIYFKAGRTIQEQSIVTDATDNHILEAPVVADFNSDGYKDLAYFSLDSNLKYLLGSAGGFSATQSFPVPPSGNAPQLLEVAEFAGGSGPDLILYTTDLSGSQTLDMLRNTTLGGKMKPNCGSYGMAWNEVAMCAPMDGFTYANPSVHFSINSHTFLPVARIEIWIDGKKAHQTFRSWSEINITLASGPHRVVAEAVMVDGRVLKQVANIKVQ